MAQSVRIEFVTLGKGGKAENVVTGLVGTPSTLAVSNTATAAASRVVLPEGEPCAVRLTAITNPVFVHWAEGGGVDATQTNSIRLAVELPEVLVLPAGAILSFIAESA